MKRNFRLLILFCVTVIFRLSLSVFHGVLVNHHGSQLDLRDFTDVLALTGSHINTKDANFSKNKGGDWLDRWSRKYEEVFLFSGACNVGSLLYTHPGAGAASYWRELLWWREEGTKVEGGVSSKSPLPPHLLQLTPWYAVYLPHWWSLTSLDSFSSADTQVRSEHETSASSFSFLARIIRKTISPATAALSVVDGFSAILLYIVWGMNPSTQPLRGSSSWQSLKYVYLLFVFNPIMALVPLSESLVAVDVFLSISGLYFSWVYGLFMCQRYVTVGKGKNRRPMKGRHTQRAVLYWLVAFFLMCFLGVSHLAIAMTLIALLLPFTLSELMTIVSRDEWMSAGCINSRATAPSKKSSDSMYSAKNSSLSFKQTLRYCLWIWWSLVVAFGCSVSLLYGYVYYWPSDPDSGASSYSPLMFVPRLLALAIHNLFPACQWAETFSRDLRRIDLPSKLYLPTDYYAPSMSGYWYVQELNYYPEYRPPLKLVGLSVPVWALLTIASVLLIKIVECRKKTQQSDETTRAVTLSQELFVRKLFFFFLPQMGIIFSTFYNLNLTLVHVMLIVLLIRADSSCFNTESEKKNGSSLRPIDRGTCSVLRAYFEPMIFVASGLQMGSLHAYLIRDYYMSSENFVHQLVFALPLIIVLVAWCFDRMLPSLKSN